MLMVLSTPICCYCRLIFRLSFDIFHIHMSGLEKPNSLIPVQYGDKAEHGQSTAAQFLVSNRPLTHVCSTLHIYAYFLCT